MTQWTPDPQLWDRIRLILGEDYLRSHAPEQVAEFRTLLGNAARGGRDAAGPVREVLSLIGDRWSTLLLQLLRYGPLRYTALQRIIAELYESGITRRMLSLKLRALQRDGLISRTVSTDAPAQVRYGLTPLGEQLWKLAATIVDWLDSHTAEIENARRQFEQLDQPLDPNLPDD